MELRKTSFKQIMITIDYVAQAREYYYVITKVMFREDKFNKYVYPHDASFYSYLHILFHDLVEKDFNSMLNVELCSAVGL